MQGTTALPGRVMILDRAEVMQGGVIFLGFCLSIACHDPICKTMTACLVDQYHFMTVAIGAGFRW